VTNAANERPIANIVGERVALGPLHRDHVLLFERWMNDFTTQRLAGFPEPAEPWTLERVTQFLDRVLAGDRTNREWFVIYETKAWRPVGHANLRDIDHLNGTAEYGITIGDSTDRGQGYGTEATRLMLDYAFTALGLNNVLLDVHAFNPAGIRAYEKAGFKVIGRRRQAYFSGGQFWDVILMDCLAADFVSPVLARILRGEEQR
jgi:RimJ/RimL family protein N-acetyltransferase